MNKLFVGFNYINGKFVAPRSDFLSHNPSTEEILGQFPLSTNEEVREAVAVARKAQPEWNRLSRIERAEYFDKLCECLKSNINDIVSLISLETGKNLNESRAEVMEALHMAQYTFGKGREPVGDVMASELAERDSYTIRKPKGVVAVIAPWNFPFAIGGFWCAAPALLEGNTVVFKPSEDTPLTGQKIIELYHQVGFPAGVINLVHGDGTTGVALVNEDVDHICFTGSAAVGRNVAISAAALGKTVSCEMGSKSACIVFDDADMDLATRAAVNSAFKLSGQRCVSSGRILVQRSCLEVFKKKFLDEVKNVLVSDPFLAGDGNMFITYGPLINAQQKQQVISFNDMVRNDSDAVVLHDPDGTDGLLSWKGHYLRPFVYQVNWSDKTYLKQEVFGPHVAIIPFDTVEDAIRIYNDTKYGLAVGILTNNYRIMRKCKLECDAGMIYFNLGSIGAESHLPFSGVKSSGYGYGSAAGTFDAVVHKVAVTVNHAEQVTFPQGLK